MVFRMTDIDNQIQELQLQIARLKERSVLELRVKLAEARGQVIALEKQLEQLSGKAPAEKAAGRKPWVSIGIEQVVAAIKEGAYNYPQIAAKLGCSSQTVANKVAAEGKKAGIKSTGQKAQFRLSLK